MYSRQHFALYDQQLRPSFSPAHIKLSVKPVSLEALCECSYAQMHMHLLPITFILQDGGNLITNRAAEDVPRSSWRQCSSSQRHSA